MHLYYEVLEGTIQNDFLCFLASLPSCNLESIAQDYRVNTSYININNIACVNTSYININYILAHVSTHMLNTFKHFRIFTL